MLRGPWGSGKTWFVDQFCKKLDEDPNKRFLYVSLFGVATAADIADQFFKKIHPKLADEKVQKAWSIAKSLLKGTLKIDLNGDGKDDGAIQISIPELGKWASTAGAVLIFDDLERVSMSMEDILGYINQFVEHEGYRVIVIANEEKYVVQEPGFTTIKEKVIGRTFEIRPNVTAALDHFLQEVAQDDAHAVLLPRCSLILEIFERAEYGNLRQLRQAILDFADLWSCLPNKGLNEKKEFLDRLVQDVISIGIEYRAGSITTDHIRDLGDHISSLKRLLGEKGEESKPSTAEMALRRHDLADRSKLALLPIAYTAFFANGHLNDEEAKQALERSRYLADERTPSWQKLWYLTSLSDAEFDRCVEDVYRRFTNCKYTKEGEFLHAAGILIDLAMSDLHRSSTNRVLALAKKTVRKLERMDLIDIGPKQGEVKHSRADMAAYGLQFKRAETTEFREIVSFYRERKGVRRKMQMAVWAKEWMNDLMSNPEQWALRIQRNNGDRDASWFSNQPVLAYAPVTIFCKAICRLGLSGIEAVHEGFQSRYEFIGEPYKWQLEELPFLKSAQKALEIHLVGRKKLALSTFALREWLLPALVDYVQRLEEFRDESARRLANASPT